MSVFSHDPSVPVAGKRAQDLLLFRQNLAGSCGCSQLAVSSGYRNRKVLIISFGVQKSNRWRGLSLSS
ncbi:hypothetical protein ACIQTZ_18990, partial [Paenarthrobacter sp. NPDC090520]|uniref:hypothetical protein n=1 Tax=Paenarthrobacter sp. NPDC090520 TaxID=3364382 RepID=UPI00380BF471